MVAIGRTPRAPRNGSFVEHLTHTQFDTAFSVGRTLTSTNASQMSHLTQSSDSTTTPGSKAEETIKIINKKPVDDEESKAAMEEAIAKRAAAEASTEVKVANKKKSKGRAAKVANKKAEGRAAKVGNKKAVSRAAKVANKKVEGQSAVGMADIVKEVSTEAIQEKKEWEVRAYSH